MAAGVYCRPVRIAVITGGSSGIGAATARALTRRGWRCVLLARERERLERMATELGAEAEPCDVADRAQVRDVAARVGERHEAIHLLVNNAGYTKRKGFLESTPEEIEGVVQTNYLGAVWALLSFLPLLEAGKPADVVNVASVAGTVAHGASGPYAATKHAQLAFSRATTPELAARGIHVHTVNPGPVETPGFPQRQLLEHRFLRLVVLTPEQVAEAIVKAVERNRTEIVLPRYLRVAGAAQALAPATLARVLRKVGGRGGGRPGPA
jgi:short-subunit dehydrogenase